MSTNFSRELSDLSDEELVELLLLAVREHRVDVQIILDRLGSRIGNEEFIKLIESIRG
jgi:hypothetical protein